MKIEAAPPRLLRAAWKTASISRSASCESSTPRFICFAAKGRMLRSITSPPLSRLRENARIPSSRRRSSSEKAFRIELHDIMFDFAVQRIEHVVEPAAPCDLLAIRPPKCISGALNHRVQDVDHA